MQRRRKNYFIKKRFQTGFAAKFLVLIAIESVFAIGFFIYLTTGSVIMKYSGTEVVMASTREFLLPPLILANLAIIAVTAMAGFAVLVLVSHRLAGPLYRFEHSLETISSGDLTHRFTLRNGDELRAVEKSLNEFTAKLDARLSAIQRELDGLEAALAAARAQSAVSCDKKAVEAVDESLKRLEALKKEAGYFKASGRGQAGGR